MSVVTQNKLLSFAEARRIVAKYAGVWPPTEPELTNLLDAVNLVLAEDLLADRDFPPFPRSTRDGFAVRAADVATVPIRLRLIGEVRAGASVAESDIKIGNGEAAEIMTGAPVPSGGDGVVMVEYADQIDGWVTIRRAVKAGENVVPAGS